MTTPETHPDLAALLRGELDNSTVLEAADHLEGCTLCSRRLGETATGHALLIRSARTLGPLAPSPGRHLAATAEAPELPPLSLPDTARRHRAWIAAGLVAATVTAAAWAGGLVMGGDRDQPPLATPTVTITPEPAPAPDVTRSAVLEPVEGSGSGRVFMSERSDSAEMRIETADLLPPGPGRFYYAWLLDPKTNKMLPLGQVSPRGTATFEVSPELLASYSAVDVSLETDDGDPGHSPRSVLRALYA